MPAYYAIAPGKIILFGEHAVVYGRPAIAVPVQQVRAKATVTFNPRGSPGQVMLRAPDIGLESLLSDLPVGHSLAAVIWKAASAMKLSHIPACTVLVTSNIPIAGGMGSGAAVSVAILRAFSASLGHPLSDEQVSQLAYEVEVIHHGTPSGIDNSVITYGQPVYFEKGKPVEVLQAKLPFTLVIGDSGVRSPTVNVVSEVRHAWEMDGERFNELFDAVGKVVATARNAIQAGLIDSLGPLMNDNHALLQKMGVSSPELDTMVNAACSAGALGAKLSGAGRGGNMIALVLPGDADIVARALVEAGAVQTITTEVRAI